MVDSLDGLKQRFPVWKSKLQAKGVRVNIGKTNVILSATRACYCKWINRSTHVVSVVKELEGAQYSAASVKKWVHSHYTNLVTLREYPQFK